MLSEQWAQMRLRPNVHDLLTEELHRFRAAVKRRPHQYPEAYREKIVSFSDLIEYLLIFRKKEAHRKASTRRPKNMVLTFPTEVDQPPPAA
jgi:hypothetical protein